MEYPVFPCGDRAVTIKIGDAISEAVNREVAAVLETLRRAAIPGVGELVPSYAAICVHYDPEARPFDALLAQLSALEIERAETARDTRPAVELPVCYGGAYGPDLPFVAERSGITPEEVVRRHSEGSYLVYMLGFLPGFAYLGGMDESIACPRLVSPRARIPAGSVGIAGSQTGIYPLASPGGWQLIGRTPVKLFSIKGETAAFALSAGDRVRFVPITQEDYREMEGRL